MIYFIFGEDPFRAKNKLEEIISGYKNVHKSGINLIYFDAKGNNFEDFYNNLKVTSMFDEKKLVVIKNIFSNAKLQEEFSENFKKLSDAKDIVVIYEDGIPDKRTKFFKTLLKQAKCQEFDFLKPAELKKWITSELKKRGVEIDGSALEALISGVGRDLWAATNEINKLSNYKGKSGVILKADVELLVRPGINNDIFKTIEAVSSGNKKLAINLLQKHIENGDNPLYLLSMVAYQFKNLLIIKELMEAGMPYSVIVKKSGLHPFVVQKTSYLCRGTSLEKLKKIYRKIFEVDSDIKTGRIDPEAALELLLVEI